MDGYFLKIIKSTSQDKKYAEFYNVPYNNWEQETPYPHGNRLYYAPMLFFNDNFMIFGFGQKVQLSK